MAKKKEQINASVIIAGIAALTILEACALFNGINGTLFTIVVVVIAAAIGVTIPTPNILKR